MGQKERPRVGKRAIERLHLVHRRGLVCDPLTVRTTQLHAPATVVEALRTQWVDKSRGAALAACELSGRRRVWPARNHEWNLTRGSDVLFLVPSKLLPPSSSGLGLWPFTPATRVRIPLGVPKRLSSNSEAAHRPPSSPISRGSHPWLPRFRFQESSESQHRFQPPKRSETTAADSADEPARRAVGAAVPVLGPRDSES